MIAEQVQQVFVQRTLLVKQENIARKNYRIGNWLKLLSLHQQNHNQQEIDTIIRNEIHQNFIMNEGFWQEEAIKRLDGPETKQKDIDLVMLALEDGAYSNVASMLAQNILKMFKAKRLRPNYCLSLFEKMITIFSIDSKVEPFFKGLRDIYKEMNATAKIRDSFMRQMKLAHDNFDLVWDEYKTWETDQVILARKEHLYEQTKRKWQQAAVDFEQSLCSETNIRRSLNNLEAVNESTIDETKYILWLDKLPTEAQKLWFLRRMAFNYKQMFEPYLNCIELLHRNDDQIIIKKYKVAIRLSNHSRAIEMKYLHFLARRLNKHLLNEPLPDDYNQIWPKNVTFFRQQITQLIQKTRVGLSQEESSKLFQDFYELWIKVEESIIKDKDSVCQLYENVVKDASELHKYEDYSESLINFGALKQAKNVLKRYIHHCGNEKSKQTYIDFIALYGTIDDITQYQKSSKKQPELIKFENEQKNEVLPQSKPAEVDKTAEQTKFKRERTEVKDEVDQKILQSTRKKVHVDTDATIYMKGIPIDWKETDVLKALLNPDKVARVRLVIKNNEQKDYCYIEYSSKESASEEVKNNKSEFKLYISKPPSEYDQSSTLFICALPQSATEQKLKQLFGDHASSIVEIRLKLSKDKNYAYVEFISIEEKQSAFEYTKKQPLVIDGKKILVQYCDSNRAKNKKFIPVVFIKNLSYKANEDSLRAFFTGKTISKILIPRSAQNKPQGFAYVEFEKFKDYQDALDMKKGNILGRQIQIFRSDRQITESHKDHPSHKHHDHSKPKEDHRHKGKLGKHGQSKQKQSETKDNSYFSNLFK